MLQVTDLMRSPAKNGAQETFSDLCLNGLSCGHALHKKGPSVADVALSHDQIVDVRLSLRARIDTISNSCVLS